MPLTNKGDKIMSAMKGEYGSKKGESVFYASKNAGKIHGVEGEEENVEEGLKRARRKRGQALRRFAENLRRQQGGK